MSNDDPLCTMFRELFHRDVNNIFSDSIESIVAGWNKMLKNVFKTKTIVFKKEETF